MVVRPSSCLSFYLFLPSLLRRRQGIPKKKEGFSIIFVFIPWLGCNKEPSNLSTRWSFTCLNSSTLPFHTIVRRWGPNGSAEMLWGKLSQCDHVCDIL